MGPMSKAIESQLKRPAAQTLRGYTVTWSISKTRDIEVRLCKVKCSQVGFGKSAGMGQVPKKSVRQYTREATLSVQGW